MEEEFIALDTETTGLSKEDDRVLELALRGFNPKTGKPNDVVYKHWYINPEKPVPEQATKVHGITNEMLLGKPKFKEISKEFLDFCAGRVIVIHNAPFDEGMLDAELFRLGLPSFRSHVAEIVDTLAISRKLKNEHNTLDALCDKFGVDRSIRVNHGALLDCDLLCQVYPHLMAQKQAVMGPLQSLLPFDINSVVADKSVDTLIEEVLALDVLLSIIEDLEKSRIVMLKQILDGNDHIGPNGKAVFSSRTNTNWPKVVEDFLKGKDLSKYQKATSAMYVKPLSEIDTPPPSVVGDEPATGLDVF